MIRPGSLAIVFALAVGCAPMRAQLQREFTPGQLQDGAHPLAYQAAAFAHGFGDGHATLWDARLEAVEKDGTALLAGLAKSPYRMELEVVPHKHEGDGMDYEFYDVNVVLVPRSGKSKNRFALPGAEGTDARVYATALEPASAATGIPSATMRKGHVAFVAAVTMLGALNATDDAMRRYAFGLLCLKEKLARGEQADYMAPLRTSKESLEDVDFALRVVAENHEITAKWRGEVLATAALVRAYESPEGPAALAEQIKESRATAQKWHAAHPQPTMAQYGVAMKELKLPTPDAMLEVLDKDGYVTAAVQVAKAVATGSPSATVQAFGKLAPKNSSLRIAADGVASALRGDVMATADAVLALADRQADVAPIAERLRRVKGAVGQVGAGVASIRSAASRPTSLGDAQRKLDQIQRGAGQVKVGAETAADAAKP